MQNLKNMIRMNPRLKSSRQTRNNKIIRAIRAFSLNRVSTCKPCLIRVGFLRPIRTIAFIYQLVFFIKPIPYFRILKSEVHFVYPFPPPPPKKGNYCFLYAPVRTACTYFFNMRMLFFRPRLTYTVRRQYMYRSPNRLLLGYLSTGSSHNLSTICLCNRCNFIVIALDLPFALSVAVYRKICAWTNAE